MLRKKTSQQSFINGLIGTSIHVLPTSKLPTNKIVLNRCLSIREENTLQAKIISKKDIASILVGELTSIWERAALPTIRVDHQIKKTINLYNSFETKIKHMKRYEEDPSKIQDYIKFLDELFDISPSNLEEILRQYLKETLNGKKIFNSMKNKSKSLKLELLV